MPVYSFAEGFQGLNSGIKSLSDAFKSADQQAYQASVGEKLAAGDTEGAIKLAYQRGDLATAQSLQQSALHQKALAKIDREGVWGEGSSAPAPGMDASAAPTPSSPARASADATPGKLPPVYGPLIISTPTGSLNMAAAKVAIAGNESAGNAAPYSVTGPKIEKGPMAGQVAIGKYQVMESNVGPWTQQYLGKAMTPEEFRASPEAQERVFEGRFGELAQKYGHGGAANAWFTGSPNPKAGANDGYTAAPDYLNGFLTKYSAAGKAMQGSPQPQGQASAAPAPSAAPAGQVPGQPPDVVRAPDGTLYGGPNAALAAGPGGAPPPIQVASAGALPTPDPRAPVAAPTIAAIQVPGYRGTFTRAQAEAAPEGDNSTPGTDEWDAAAKASPAAAPSPAPGATALAPPGVSPAAAAGASDPVVRKVASQPVSPTATPAQAQAGAEQLLSQLPAGDPRRIQFLQGRELAYAAADMKGVADVYGTLLKSELEAAAPTSSMKEFGLASTNPEFAKFLSKDKTPAEQTKLQFAMDNFQKLGLPDPSLVGKDPAVTKAWQDYSTTALGLTKGPLISMPGAEKAKEAKVGGAQGEDIAADIHAGSSAPRRLQALAVLSDANKAGGDDINSGPLAALFLKGKQIASDLGIEVAGLAPAEVVQKVGFDLTTQLVKAISVRPAQMEFLKGLENVPGLFLSKNGRIAMTSILTQEARNDIELSRLANRKENWDDWPAVRQKFYDEHPLISPFTGKAFGQADIPILGGQVTPGASAAPQGTPLVPPAGGRAAPATAPPQLPAGTTPEQARKLYPSGTPITLPDGSQGWVP